MDTEKKKDVFQRKAPCLSREAGALGMCKIFFRMNCKIRQT